MVNAGKTPLEQTAMGHDNYAGKLYGTPSNRSRGGKETIMTSRERLKLTLAGKVPDCVPVAPDMSNMIPSKMTGLPFWDIYLYQKIPLWQAYIRCAKYFDIDSLMDGYVGIDFDDIYVTRDDRPWETAIISEDSHRIVTRRHYRDNGQEVWADTVDVYYADNPPNHGIALSRLRLPDGPPSWWRPLEGVKQWPTGAELLSLAKRELGDQGLFGVNCGTTLVVDNVDAVYAFYDDPNPWYERRDRLLDFYERKLHRLMSLPDKPDFITTGASGTLVFQTEAMFRELGLPILQRIASLCKGYGVPSHVHSCGPESKLVEIAANETDLTVIDPLETPPMGDCDLCELKRLYGSRLVLKGNLHTTDVMLRGTPEEVRKASEAAMDAAGAGGRFILSTGDQCGRDTPDANIRIMVETARTYGKYA